MKCINRLVCFLFPVSILVVAGCGLLDSQSPSLEKVDTYYWGGLFGRPDGVDMSREDWYVPGALMMYRYRGIPAGSHLALDSTDPGVVSVDFPPGNRVSGRGISPGRADIILSKLEGDRSIEQVRRTVEVHVPDSALLLNDYRADRGNCGELSRHVHEDILRVGWGSEATFYVFYLKDGFFLDATDAQILAAEGSIAVDGHGTDQISIRVWERGGAGTLILSTGDHVVAEIPVISVDPEDIAGLEILGETPPFPDTPELNEVGRVLCSAATDHDGNPISQLAVDWFVDGVLYKKGSPFLSYKFEHGKQTQVQIRYGWDLMSEPFVLPGNPALN